MPQSKRGSYNVVTHVGKDEAVYYVLFFLSCNFIMIYIHKVFVLGTSRHTTEQFIKLIDSKPLNCSLQHKSVFLIIFNKSLFKTR